MSSRIYRDEAERRHNVRADAQQRHPDSALLVGLLIAWSDAEAACKVPGLSPDSRRQAEQTARTGMEEYRRVKSLPIVFPYAVTMSAK